MKFLTVSVIGQITSHYVTKSKHKHVKTCSSILIIHPVSWSWTSPETYCCGLGLSLTFSCMSWSTLLPRPSTLLPTRSTLLPVCMRPKQHGRLCCQCVWDQSDTVDFVASVYEAKATRSTLLTYFHQSQPCWVQLCRQCVPGLTVTSLLIMWYFVLCFG